MYLGLDIGTTRVKITLISGTSRILAADTLPTPTDLLQPGANLIDLIDSAAKLILKYKNDFGPPRAVGISAIAPALVAFFEQSPPRLLFSHLTPSEVRDSQGPTLSSRLNFRQRRTIDRLSQCDGRFAGGASFFLPLASALALAMTGQFQLDPINAYELGFRTTEHLRTFCRLPAHYSRPKCITDRTAELELPTSIRVTTDTCASFIGAGLRKKSDGMIYYGTYHSALELNISAEDCLFADGLVDVPYFWHVSLPQYGRFLESFLMAVRAGVSFQAAFDWFEQVLNSSLSKLVLPRVRVIPELPTIVTSDTPLSVRIDNLSTTVDAQELIRALASPLGEAIRGKLHSGDLGHVERWFAAGGGVQSNSLVLLTSNLTNLRQTVLVGAGTAKGSALSAAWGIGERSILVDEESETLTIEPSWGSEW